MAIMITLVIISAFGIYALYIVEKQKKHPKAH